MAIHADKNQILLSWKQRLQIALDSATGEELINWGGKFYRSSC